MLLLTCTSKLQQMHTDFNTAGHTVLLIWVSQCTAVKSQVRQKATAKFHTCRAQLLSKLHQPFQPKESATSKCIPTNSTCWSTPPWRAVTLEAWWNFMTNSTISAGIRYTSMLRWEEREKNIAKYSSNIKQGTYMFQKWSLEPSSPTYRKTDRFTEWDLNTILLRVHHILRLKKPKGRQVTHTSISSSWRIPH